MGELVPSGSKKDLGNIRPNPARKWCFTLHNGENSKWNGDLGSVVPILKGLSKKGVVAQEYGKSGETPHLQGYVEFTKKIRPIGTLDATTCWSLAKGTDQHNLNYISKEGGDIIKWGFQEEVIVFEPIGWQIQLTELLSEEPVRRKIYWYWGPARMGKTEFCRYLCVKMGAIIVGGKSSDMKYAVSSYFDKNGNTPKLIIMDIPFCKQEYVSYEGIEACKNMLFFSPKYESGMICGNPPHVVCFANRPPDFEKMSEPEWFEVHEITKQECPFDPAKSKNARSISIYPD